ncbi:MAG TPA: hypothetical protein VN285_02850 [Candidatus Deferrimicrobium sp.]|nr:hypothetical protein [Candidatus Deferrimicrobium sp.]
MKTTALSGALLAATILLDSCSNKEDSPVSPPEQIWVCDTSDCTRAVDVAGDYAFVVLYRPVFQVLDITESAPILIGSCSTSFNTYDLLVDGDLAFVSRNVGLDIIDISDAARPALVGKYDRQIGSGSGMFRRSNILLTTTGYTGADPSLLCIDVSDAATPTLVGNLTYQYGLSWGEGDPMIALSHAVASGNFAIVSYEKDSVWWPYPPPLYGGMLLIDISDPTKPFEATRVSAGLAIIVDMAVRDSLLFVVTGQRDGGSRLTIYDLSDLPNLPAIGSYSDSNYYAFLVEVAYNHVFLGGYSAIRVLNVSTPSSPVLLRTLAVSGVVGDMAISGEYIYLAKGEGGLEILKWTP